MKMPNVAFGGYRFVILSAAKNLVFLRFFGRFAPSE